MRLLYVAARLPEPLVRGYEVRAFHQLRLLARRHRITLLTYVSGAPAAGAMERLSELCDEVVVVPLRLAGMAAGVARGLGAGLPFQTAMYDTPAMRREVHRLLAERRHDVIHVQMPRLAALLEGDAPLPRVIDLIDALSVNMARRRDLDRGITRWLAGLEAERLARYERALCATWDRAIVASEADRRAIGDFANLVVVSNAVDLERFPLQRGARTPGTIAFTGNLGYFPNVDAVSWFAREVLPLVRAEIADATLTVVGARPTRVVRALEGLGPHVRVVGPVADLASYIGRARVAVAPIRAGSGQSLKVLEAMACGTPVVATSRAVEGLAVEDDRHLLVGDDAGSFARQVVRLLRDEDLARRLASEARRRVEERYRWEASVDELDALYESLGTTRCASSG
jgi:sugar transferase (PEP-CTERM/EpsH1 system associated)